MKKALAGLGFLALVGCSGSGVVTPPPRTTQGSTGSTGANHGTGGTASGGTTGSLAGTTTGTTGGCLADGMNAGVDQGSLCCSGQVDASGVCTEPGASTSGGGTTGSTHMGGTGTTTGGTCPANVPNINNGTSQVGGSCTMGELGQHCPTGFTCINNQCVLNGAGGGVQITLSFDDNEDLDLHVIEPESNGGTCEIYYGNRGPVPDAGDTGLGFGNCTSVCWLDRDSNAGCSIDGINIENVICPPDQKPPSGTWQALVDYWANCDGKSQSNYAVQVRANGVTNIYCGTVDASQADMGDVGAGTVVTTFTTP